MRHPYLSLCLALAAATLLPAADFFPLQAGNTWVYRDATTGHTMEVRALTPVINDDKVYYPVRGFLPDTALVRVDERNNLVYLDQEQSMEFVIAGFTGSTTAYSSNGRVCPTFATTNEKRNYHDGPAGPWSVLEVSYEPYACADAGETLEQYTENIGMVRRVVTTIAGPRTYDLVFARLGQQVIEAGEKGRFNIAVLPGADRASWQVNLRVDPLNSAALPVRFPTSQEFEVRLLNQAGEPVYTWSADKVFLQQEHTRADVGGWSATLSVPYPARAGNTVDAYTLEAWLTTDSPRFASATTLTLYPAPGPALQDSPQVLGRRRR